MRRFTDLVFAAGATRSTSRKTELLAAYVSEAPPEDVGHALSVLLGRRTRRMVSTRLLRTWAAEESGVPDWMMAACHDHAGDLAETLALLVPEPSAIEAPDRPSPSLDTVMRRYVLAPEMQSPRTARPRLVEAWEILDRRERFVLHKLIGGAFRIGVARGLVVAALARVAGVETATIAQRLSGSPRLDGPGVARLLDGSRDPTADAARPHPLALATPLDVHLDVDQLESPACVGSMLGPRDDWIIEPKWDGIRGQLVRRDGTVALWSRHDEPVGPSFPEITSAARRLGNDVVLDGEILAIDGDEPLPFTVLQRRLGSRPSEPTLFGGLEVAFVAFDLLELDGKDLRERPLHERRVLLDEVLGGIDRSEAIRAGDVLPVDDWEAAATIRDQSRARGVEGLMVKRRNSAYRGGRIRGDWWKWKVAPYTVDLVVTAATLGHGRRAALHSDYTLAAWSGDAGGNPRELVTVARAYSGLTDVEVEALDRRIRSSTVERRGPVRIVEPTIVLEIRFDGVQRSSRHRGGLALRFPRIARTRLDKSPENADDLHLIESLIPSRA